jgi:peptidoglycan glycosyltransferase
MNAPIVRIYAFFLILFATLVALTSNWSVFQASELEANAENRRPLLEEQRVARGEIRSSDGELLAESVRSGKGERRQFTRDYPTGELFAHPVGYSFIEEGRTGIEQSFNDTLVGNENEFLSIVDQIRGRTEEGSDLTLTLDAGAQELATELLAPRERWWRSSRPPERSGRWPRRRATTRTRSPSRSTRSTTRRRGRPRC